MSLSLPRNPFSSEFLLSSEFPWKEPLGWPQIRAANSILAHNQTPADAILNAGVLDRNPPSEVRSLMVVVPKGATLTALLKASTYEAAKRWIKVLARDISPLFTMHPTDAILVMRLLLWSEGSIEAAEFALRAENPKHENVREFANAFDRNRNAVLDIGIVTPNTLLTWICLRPKQYKLTQLLIVQIEDGSLEHIGTFLRWASHYNSLKIKVFLASHPMRTVDNMASVILTWTVNDLETMVDRSVAKVAYGKSFDGIEGMIQVGLEMEEYLGDQSLLAFLADHANGSIAQLMTYCNAILQAYSERMELQPGSAPDAILRTDVMSVLNRFGLEKYDRT